MHLENCTIPKKEVTVFKDTVLQAEERSSYKEHMVDALAPGADEGRDKLR